MNMRSIFFDFRGKLPREGYLGAILAACGAFACILLTTIVIRFTVNSEGVNDIVSKLFFTAALAFLWVNMAITAKRLRDIGLSGWLQAPAWIINFLPLLIPGKPMAGISWTISIAVFAALSIIPSKTEA